MAQSLSGMNMPWVGPESHAQQLCRVVLSLDRLTLAEYLLRDCPHNLCFSQNSSTIIPRYDGGTLRKGGRPAPIYAHDRNTHPRSVALEESRCIPKIRCTRTKTLGCPALKTRLHPRLRWGIGPRTDAIFRLARNTSGNVQALGALHSTRNAVTTPGPVGACALCAKDINISPLGSDRTFEVVYG
jgi:hypothetical protein